MIQKKDPKRIHAEYVKAKLTCEAQIRDAESLIVTARRTLEEAFEAYKKARLELCFKERPSAGTRVRWVRAGVGLAPDKDLTGAVVNAADADDKGKRVQVLWDVQCLSAWRPTER